MRNKILALTLMILAIAVGCSKKEKNMRDAASPSASALAAPGAEKEFSRPREFRAARYTDDGQWLNGINRQQRSQFVFTVGKEDPTPFLPGFRLRFAESGTATIAQVYRLENPGNSGIFITVDKDLDPLGDGHPHKILIESLSLQACRFSKDALWRNGISLTQPGTFLFQAEKRTQLPFKAGDRLKFAAAGEAVITRVSRNESGEGFSRFFITVDKPLDPVGDGHPKLIEFEI